MFDKNTDKHWEAFGSKEPYFGVLTDERYKSVNLDARTKTTFFKSGEEDIEKAFSVIHKHIDKDFRPKNVLDFGCGVGRLLLPLAMRAEKATGVDVSESMLSEAHKNCAEKGISNIVLVKSDDRLSNIKDYYDFIHSYIVFQHIPISRGEVILEELLNRLSLNGVGALHFTFSNIKDPSPLRKWFRSINNYIPGYRLIRKLFIGMSLNAPEMQMNCYNVNRLLFILQKKGITSMYTQLLRHGDFLSIFLFFKKEC
jgi:cyclopropane fatty-acyl-phospholipid synthase-like methyltransferase